jgi:hypothetical protein
VLVTGLIALFALFVTGATVWLTVPVVLFKVWQRHDGEGGDGLRVVMLGVPPGTIDASLPPPMPPTKPAAVPVTPLTALDAVPAAALTVPLPVPPVVAEPAGALPVPDAVALFLPADLLAAFFVVLFETCALSVLLRDTPGWFVPGSK